jgi:hypothetical protein
MPDPRAIPKDPTTFKVIIALATLCGLLAIALCWVWTRTLPVPSFASPTSAGKNLIRQKYPEVDFTAIYPGTSSAEIDRLQRASLGLRYAYAPFVEFEPLPVAGDYVNITPAGYRAGRTTALWPPAADAFNVFVFGGSTTLGFGVRDGDTVASALEETLGRHYSGRTVRCYNFGRGYYFSTQERLLLTSLLAQGIRPQLALFIDGLNDFVYADGIPQLAPALRSFTAADHPLSPPPALATDSERAAAVAQIIDRYRHHVRQTEAIARAYGVPVLFIGQPVPFIDFEPTPADYPFPSTYIEHRLAGWGYDRFKQAARDGQFGDRFVWCGNAFARAQGAMYVDSIHYSRAGAEILAQCITERAAEAGLLP